MLPWMFLLQLTAVRFSWTPAEFWAATPRELQAVLGLPEVTMSFKRGDLEQMMKEHPDIPLASTAVQENGRMGHAR